MTQGYLILSGGEVFRGRLFGAADKISIGEIVFNTSMTGYPEILTDPSYNGQIVLFTYPLIGNYGYDGIWAESSRMTVSALVVKKLYTGPVPPGRKTLDEALAWEGITGIEGIDTRALTLKIREEGSCNALICSEENLAEGLEMLKTFPSITERDLIHEVAVKEKEFNPLLGDGFTLPPSDPVHHIALVDFGIKLSIISNFYKRNTAVTLLPPSFTAEEVLDGTYDMLFLSNGPGDPALLQEQVGEIRKCIGKIPVCGICLGHQLITWALGGRTVKMTYGHHGGNQPVRDLESGRSFVTAQNHNYMSDPSTLPEGARIWFTNANDGTVEGLFEPDLHVRSVQFHPEASPGPDDALWIFDSFLKEIGK